MAQASLPTYTMTPQEAEQQFGLLLPFDMTLSGVSEVSTSNSDKIEAVLRAKIALEQAMSAQREIDARMKQMAAESRALNSRGDLHSIADVYAVEASLKALEPTKQARIAAVAAASLALTQVETTHRISTLPAR